MAKYSFGRKPSPVDKHDYPLRLYEPKDLGDLKGGETVWPFNAPSLDQGNTPHCVGFGGAGFGINVPIEDAYTNETGHDFYYQCKVIDGEPRQENGSYVRSIAKVLQNVGRIKNYAWAVNTDEITYWLINNGPVIVGVNWYNGMMNPDANNVIHPTGGIAGGHCVILNGKINSIQEYYRIHNSWGDSWGQNGEALISITDFAKLLMEEGEAMTAVEEPLGPVPPEPDPDKPGCLPTFLKMFGIKI